MGWDNLVMIVCEKGGLVVTDGTFEKVWIEPFDVKQIVILFKKISLWSTKTGQEERKNNCQGEEALS